MRVWSWRQAICAAELEATTKLVLLVLSTRMNDHGGSCFPSIETIVKESSLSRRSVIAHIEKAVLAGFLTKSRSGKKGQAWAANAYHARFPDHATLAEGSAADAPPLLLPDDAAGSTAQTTEHEREIEAENAAETPAEKGSAADAPPCQNAGEGGAGNSTKVVHQMHTNSPVNSSIPPYPPGGGSPPLKGFRFEREAHIPDAWLLFAKGMGWPLEVTLDQYDRFADHFEAATGPGSQRTEWLKTWRNWCRREHDSLVRQGKVEKPLPKKLAGEEADAPLPMPRATAATSVAQADAEKWQAALEFLGRRLGTATAAAWFGKLTLLNVTPVAACFSGGGTFVVETIRSKWLDDFRAALIHAGLNTTGDHVFITKG